MSTRLDCGITLTFSEIINCRPHPPCHSSRCHTSALFVPLGVQQLTTRQRNAHGTASSNSEQLHNNERTNQQTPADLAGPDHLDELTDVCE